MASEAARVPSTLAAATGRQFRLKPATKNGKMDIFGKVCIVKDKPDGQDGHRGLPPAAPVKLISKPAETVIQAIPVDACEDGRLTKLEA
mmetsp:Transcript_72864/g.159193  ORF Transcript_72864/g.159193 Transcript_72864/m.159193 type:complete len:89 (+) Transcript_72864:439-705(+)